MAWQHWYERSEVDLCGPEVNPRVEAERVLIPGIVVPPSGGGRLEEKVAWPARPAKFERILIVWNVSMKIMPFPHIFHTL